MAQELIVPPAIEQIIQKFETSDKPFTELEVYQELCTARGALSDPSAAENLGAWSEVLAFGLIEGRTYVGGSPWGTYFAPIGAATGADGRVQYFPDFSNSP